MTDFLMLKRLHKMINEIPRPRLAFKKGIIAGGFFRPYMSLSDYTEARIFESYDEITPVTVRFASMLGHKGTADTVRNIKGMNVKFHSDGQYDMMCRNIPVSFINESSEFFSVCDAFSKKESFDGINNSEIWKFIVAKPEAVNCALRLFSYEGLSKSFIDIQWFSVNLNIWKNREGKTFLVKHKWVPVHDNDKKNIDAQVLDRISAEFMAGFDSNIAMKELEKAISLGNFPKFELHIQMRDYDESTDADCLKRTLLWSEDDFPYVAVGIMRLTEIPDGKKFRQDLVSFAPGNVVAGIDIYRDEFTDILDYLYRLESLERGECD